MAQAYFDENAAEWDRIRSLHIAERDVEAAILDALGPGPYDLLLDLGTGTGRILELASSRARQLIGIDTNREMLKCARVRLDKAGLTNCGVRLADIYNLPFPENSADAVLVHQVLHFLDNPKAALAEAARVLKPGGRLAIIDFAPHNLEFLREEHAHVRLDLPRRKSRHGSASCGIGSNSYRGLQAGTAKENALTVAIWTGERPKTAAKTMEGRFVRECNEHHGHSAPVTVSFEFFPPKTAAMEATLWAAIRRLEPLQPEFVSVTYGAGGSTRERTHATVSRILQETSLKPAAHLTCVAATKEEVDGVVRAYWEAGVRHIVALRGDPPEGPGTAYVQHPGGYMNAADLTAGIKRIADFEVSVAAYPEKHPDSPSVEADLDMLQAKVDAGAIAGDYELLLQQRRLLALSGAGPRAGHLDSNRSRPNARSTISNKSQASRRDAVRPCRLRSPRVSKVWRTIPKRHNSSPPRSRRSRPWTLSRAASPSSTSIR